METTFSIDIARSPRDVFAFLDDDANLQRMVPTLVSSGIIHETPDKVRSTFWHLYEEQGRPMRMMGTVTEYDAPRRLAVALRGRVFDLDVAYDLDAVGADATRLVQTTRLRFKHVFKIIGWLSRAKMTREGAAAQEKSFAIMKGILESEPRQ